MDLRGDILNFIEQNPKKKVEIAKYCTKLGHNKRTAYREIDRLEEEYYILFDKSTQKYFLLPYITSLKRDLLKQKEKGFRQEVEYAYDSILLDSYINEYKSIVVFANKNIKISDESFRLLSQFIRGILLDSKINSIKDLNFEMKIKANLEYYDTLDCIKNLKKTKWLPGIES